MGIYNYISSIIVGWRQYQNLQKGTKLIASTKSHVGFVGLVMYLNGLCYAQSPTNFDGPDVNCAASSLFVLENFLKEDMGSVHNTWDYSFSKQKSVTIQELIEGADAIGIELITRKFTMADSPLSSPVIAFLKNEDEGHFVVLRPIGTTDNMVQVVDPAKNPRVLDYADVIKSPSWTGIILVPATQKNWSFMLITSFAIACCCISAFKFAKHIIRSFPNSVARPGK